MADDRTLDCSFCGKSQHDVRKLIAGPTVFICDECVELCSKVLQNEFRQHLVKATGGVPMTIEISEAWDQRFPGQAASKQALSNIVYRHYRRLAGDAKPASHAAVPTHVLLCGSSMSRGKAARILERYLDVPFVVFDATALIELQRKRDVSHSILYALLEEADFDPDLARRGIIYVDDFDQLGRPEGRSSVERNEAGVAVQRVLAGLMTGVMAEPPKEQDPRLAVATHAMTFICAGSFFGLAEAAASGGDPTARSRKAGIRAAGPHDTPPHLADAEATALAGFGLLPELVCRLFTVISIKGTLSGL